MHSSSLDLSLILGLNEILLYSHLFYTIWRGINKGCHAVLSLQLLWISIEINQLFTSLFPVSGTVSMQLFIHPLFTGDLAQKWSLLKYFLHTLRTLIHGCLAIPGALVFHMVALTSQFEGRTRCTVGAALKMSPPPTICCSTVTFSSSDQTGTVTDCHVHISTAIFCQLTCVLQRAIYRPTSLNVHYICKCSAVPIENIYCGLVLLFYCCCIGGVCEVLRVKVRLMAYIFTLDWWVQKWYGCKYFV